MSDDRWQRTEALEFGIGNAEFGMKGLRVDQVSFSQFPVASNQSPATLTPDT